MKRVAPKRGRPKQRISLEGYKFPGGRGQGNNRKIFEFIKAQRDGGIRPEKAIEAAMEQFDITDRSTIQRKIAPFELAEKTVREGMEILATGSAPYKGIVARLAVFFSDEEIAELGKLSPPLVLKLAAKCEEVERLRHALAQVTAKVCRK